MESPQAHGDSSQSPYPSHTHTHGNPHTHGSPVNSNLKIWFTFKAATSVEDFCRRRLLGNHNGVECDQWAVTDSELEDDNEDMT